MTIINKKMEILIMIIIKGKIETVTLIICRIVTKLFSVRKTVFSGYSISTFLIKVVTGSVH